VLAHGEITERSAAPTKVEDLWPFVSPEGAEGFLFVVRLEQAMKKWSLGHWLSMLGMISGLVVFVGCDSGEKARDELTGNRAVKQYHQSTKNIEKIVDRQAEKHKSFPDDEKEDSKSE
jgi:hypothetical protein